MRHAQVPCVSFKLTHYLLVDVSDTAETLI